MKYPSLDEFNKNNIGDDELSKKYRELFENNYSRNAVN